MPDPAYPPKPERDGYRSVSGSATDPFEIADANSYHNAAIDAAEAHYDPQITALKARIAELEGVLRELVATHRPPSGIWHDEDSPALRQNDAFAAAKSTLEPTTSGEGE